ETSGSRSSASTRSISDPAWHRLPHGARTTPARSARGPARRRLAARLGRHRFDPGHTVVRSTAYSTKGTTMSTTPATAIAPRRELAQRAADGVEVTLYWDSICDSVAVEVRDASSEKTFEITVPRDRALDAFHHPFAYAASLTPRDAPPLASAAQR